MPATRERKESSLESGARRLIVFVNPKDADENAFVLFSPVQPDYTSLGSFGSIDNVAATVLPPADFPSEMLEMASEKGSYVFDYTITAPGEPKRHLKTAFSPCAGDDAGDLHVADDGEPLQGPGGRRGGDPQGEPRVLRAEPAEVEGEKKGEREGGGRDAGCCVRKTKRAYRHMAV